MGTKKPTKSSPRVSKKQPIINSHRRLKKWLLGTAGVMAVLIVGTIVAFHASPWPGSMLIRYLFDKGGLQTAEKLDKYVPSGIVSTLNQQYRPGDKDAQLDVYYPASVAKTQSALPTVVWVHGGAWVSGNKSSVANYLKILSSYGYTTVSINYSIAPEKHYPLPVIQTNAALRYLNSNATRLHIDSSKFMLAGDSAGSQIAAQVGTIITNPDYAKKMNMTAPLQPTRLKAMLLNCGAYDLDLVQKDKASRSFVDTVLWAYTGKKTLRRRTQSQAGLSRSICQL